MRSRSSWIDLLVMVLGLLLAAAARASEVDPREQVAEAVRLYQEGRYQEALADLQALYERQPLPRLLLDIGRVHLKLGQPAQALAAFERYQAAVPHPEPKEADLLERSIAEARAQLSLHVAPPAPPPAALPAPAPTPPRALLAVPALPPHKPPLYQRWWLWTAVGAAVAVGTGVGLGVGLTRAQANVPGNTAWFVFHL